MAATPDIAKVLVIARGPLAAFVPALAAMRRIREAHPTAKITLLTTPAFDLLARACPYFDLVDPGGEPEGFSEWGELVGRMRAARFDRVYDLEGSAWTSRLFQLLRPFPPAWSGTAAGCALPHRNPQRAAMHPIERHAEQLKAAGVWPDAPTAPGAAPPPDAGWIKRRQPDPRGISRPQVLLVPGEMAEPAERRWPAPAFGELAVALRAQGYDIAILGGTADSPLAHAIQRRAPARDLTGRHDYAQIAMLGGRAALAVGANTGLMSLVAAAGAPCLILQAGEAESRRPAPRGHVTVLYAESLAGLHVGEVLRAADHLTPAIQKSM